MKIKIINLMLLSMGIIMSLSCRNSNNNESTTNTSDTTIANSVLKPVRVTEPVKNDSDDPAIWVNSENPEESLILGTDKGNDANIGAIYTFNLKGQILPEKTLDSLQRPNNIDVEYGMVMDGDTFDIAVFTERFAEAIRVVRLPEMEFIDGGGIPVFTGEEGPEYSLPMGVSLYKRPADGAIFAIVGRKNGPEEGYLWQYRLQASGGHITGTRVRQFGNFSGQKEIEAIFVDDAMGYVYYSDEGYGIHKYYADPDSSNTELALFGREGFQDDHEGISIYPTGEKSGYILVSDQQSNSFRVFERFGSDEEPHRHEFIREIPMSTVESDGSEVTAVNLGSEFPQGLFVAMSDDGTFQLYDWRDLATVLP